MANHSLIGKELGNYIIRAPIGTGGMAAVFRAEHKFFGDKVAIKVLHGSFADDPAISQRFFQEAKATRDISHPNVIKIIDFGQNTDGCLYLVMELLEGDTLAAMLGHGPLGERAALRVGAAIADGLGAAHAQGIIHRDLKPGNIVITKELVKVLDFGIAKVLSGGNRTDTGTLLGTPRFMAPEQARGAKFVGPHSDIYSLGVILFLMVTGRTPFDGSDVQEILAKVLFDPAPRPSTIAEVSPQLEDIILRCLEKDVTKRPSSMAVVSSQMLALLGNAALDLPTGVSPPTPTGVLPHTSLTERSPDTISGSVGESIALQSSRRRRLSWAAVITLGVMLFGAAGVVGLTKMRHPTPAAEPRPAPPVDSTPPPSSPPTVVNPPLPPSKPVVEPVTTQQVVVRTTPAGAQVTVGGKVMGSTPALLQLTLPQSLSITLRGYRPTHEVVMKPGEVTIQLTPEPATKRVVVRKKTGKDSTTPTGLGLD